MINFGGNETVRCDEIWKIAARNNKRQAVVTYRINGERVTKSEFDKYKGVRELNL